MRAGRLRHDGKPVLMWCIGNVGKADRRGNLYPMIGRATSRPKDWMDPCLIRYLGNLAGRTRRGCSPIALRSAACPFRIPGSFELTSKLDATHGVVTDRNGWISAGLLRRAEALKAVAAMAARPSAAVLVGTYIHLWPGPPPDCPPAPGRARASPPRSSSDPETLS